VNNPELAKKRLQLLCANHDRAEQVLGSVEAIVEMEEHYEYDEHGRYWLNHLTGEI